VTLKGICSVFAALDSVAIGKSQKICTERHKSVKRPQFGSNTKRGNSIAREGRG
jgi:hypothetical protein